MSIITEAGLTLTDSPLICYDNVVTVDNVASTTEETAWPAINLANDSTYLKWLQGAGSPSSDEYLTVTLTEGDYVDYLAIAVHNLYSGAATVSIEGDDGGWSEIIAPHTLDNDKPTIWVFDRQVLTGIRLRIQAGMTETPHVAVMYAGRRTQTERRVYVGHSPITLARQISTVNHRSISGAYLGNIVKSESYSTTLALQNLTAAWVRNTLNPMLISDSPFFFAWRPNTYSDECAYAWLRGDPTISNQRSNGMMQASLPIDGIV
jgi:hypothetical protein